MAYCGTFTEMTINVHFPCQVKRKKKKKLQFNKHFSQGLAVMSMEFIFGLLEQQSQTAPIFIGVAVMLLRPKKIQKVPNKITNLAYSSLQHICLFPRSLNSQSNFPSTSLQR